MIGEVLGLVNKLLDVFVEQVLGLVEGGDYLQDEVVEEGVQQLQHLTS